MNEKEILLEINENMKKLLGATAIQGKEKEDKIHTLKAMGFKSKDIQSITGISESTVRNVWNKKLRK